MKKMNILENLPEYEKNQFLRWIAEAKEEYFKDPENQIRFEEWKKIYKWKAKCWTGTPAGGVKMSTYTKEKCPICRYTLQGWTKDNEFWRDRIGEPFQRCPNCKRDIRRIGYDEYIKIENQVFLLGGA